MTATDRHGRSGGHAKLLEEATKGLLDLNVAVLERM
jgi:hypothetical protein